MGRGFVLTNTRSYSHVLMTTLLVGVCAFIILAHVKCMHMHSHKHTSNSSTGLEAKPWVTPP